MNIQRFHLASAALVLSAGLASAQISGTTDFYRPLTTAKAAQPATNSHVKVMMSQSDGDDTYEVTINGDKVTATVNGKEVPKDRIRRNADTIEILGKNGDVVSTFTTQAHTAWTWDSSPSVNYILGNGNSAGGWTVAGPDQKPPAVMLGVTMVEPSEMMAEQLQLEPGTGVQLDRVVDGLGADKAGLKKGDVIVSFDGVKPVTVAKVRELLAKKDAGDKVQVVYLRKGDEKTTTLELQKYDSSRLDTPMARLAPKAAQARDEAMKAHEDAQRAMEEALRQRVITLQGRPGASNWVFGPSGDQFEVYTKNLGQASPEAKEKVAELQKKISELDEKLSKLDEAMDRLEKKLDKLNERK